MEEELSIIKTKKPQKTDVNIFVVYIKYKFLLIRLYSNQKKE